MTIQELIDEAKRVDPRAIIEVWDRVDYKTGQPPKRVVNAYVFSLDHGEGSHEAITIEMGVNRSLVGSRLTDQVAGISVGPTVLFWQADPLRRAFERLTVRSAEAVG